MAYTAFSPTSVPNLVFDSPSTPVQTPKAPSPSNINLTTSSFASSNARIVPMNSEDIQDEPYASSWSTVRMGRSAMLNAGGNAGGGGTGSHLHPPRNPNRRASVFFDLANLPSKSCGPQEIGNLLNMCKEEVVERASPGKGFGASISIVMPQLDKTLTPTDKDTIGLMSATVTTPEGNVTVLTPAELEAEFHAQLAERDEQILLCVDMGQQLLQRLDESNKEWQEKIDTLTHQHDQNLTELQKYKGIVLHLEAAAAERDIVKLELAEARIKLGAADTQRWLTDHAAAVLKENQDIEIALQQQIKTYEEATAAWVQEVGEYKAQLLGCSKEMKSMCDSLPEQYALVQADYEVVRDLMLTEFLTHFRFNVDVLQEVQGLEGVMRTLWQSIVTELTDATITLCNTTAPTLTVQALRKRIREQDHEILELRPLREEVLRLRKLHNAVEYKHKLMLSEVDGLRAQVSKTNDGSPGGSRGGSANNSEERPECPLCVETYKNMQRAKTDAANASARERALFEKCQGLESSLAILRDRVKNTDEERNRNVAAVGVMTEDNYFMSPQNNNNQSSRSPSAGSASLTMTEVADLIHTRRKVHDLQSALNMQVTETDALREELVRTRFYADTRSALIQATTLVLQTLDGTVSMIRNWTTQGYVLTKKELTETWGVHSKVLQSVRDTVKTCLTRDEILWSGL